MSDRSQILFQEAFTSESTRTLYQSCLEAFLKFHNITGDRLLTMQKDEIQRMVEDYVFSLKKTVSRYGSNITRATIKGYLQGIKLFLDLNDVMINWIKIKKFLPEASKRTGQKAYTDEDVRAILNFSVNKKYSCLVHLLASSGMRIGAVPLLRLKHLGNMSHGCKSVLYYADTIAEAITFISPEAVKALDEYLDERKSQGDIITLDSFVIVNSSKRGFKQCNRSTIRMITARHVKELKDRKLITGNLRDKMLNHAFRKRFNTILKSNKEVNIVLAERMLGHSVTIPLDNSYLDVSKEKLFAEYLKVLPELYVDEKYKLEAQLISSQQRIEEFESKDEKIKSLELKMEELSHHFENLRSKSLDHNL